MTYIPAYCVVVPRAISFSRFQFEMLRLKSSYKVHQIHLVTQSLIMAHLWVCNQPFSHITGSFFNKVLI